MKQQSAFAAYATVLLANILGETSLLLFGIFLLRAPFHMVDFGLTRSQALLFDSVLCLAFFVQDSVMVRPSFHLLTQPVVPTHYRGTGYTISSALVLLALLILWQRTSPALPICPVTHLVVAGGNGRSLALQCRVDRLDSDRHGPRST
jgi:hypothetical protein